MRKIRRILFIPPVWKTVTPSQVFNWVKLVTNNSNIETECVSLNGNQLSREELQSIRSELNIAFNQKSVYPLVINDLYIIYQILYLYFKYVFSKEKLIFQTRITKIGISFQILRLLPKSRMIYEARGAATEEKTYVSNEDDTKKSKFKSNWIKKSEKVLIEHSDAIICVSHALKNYYIKKYGLSNAKKFVVLPGAADSSLFYYNKLMRESTRAKLSFESEDIVIVYSGKLSKKWEIPEILFNFLKVLSEYDSRVKLLILTPDIDIAKEHIHNYDLKTKSIVLESRLEEVNMYLNAADIGILLRENVLMNNVASPTKFSEYILSGLPVIISEGINDFAEIVSKNQFGFVLNEDFKVSKAEIGLILELRRIDRIKISEWGSKYLSKEQFIEEYIKLLQNI